MSSVPTLIPLFGIVFQVSDLINGVLLFAAVLGLIVTVVQIRRGSKSQQAAFFKELYLNVTDEHTLEALAMVEYNEFVFNAHPSKDEEYRRQELKLNSLLGLANAICTLRLKGLISEQEVKYFQYLITVLYTNAEVTKYLKHLGAAVFAPVLHDSGQVKPYMGFQKYCRDTLKLDARAGEPRALESVTEITNVS